jgi:Cytochrome P460
VTFPQGTVLDGLANVATTGAATRIRFPQPGEVTPAATRSTKQDNDGHLTTLGFAYVNEAGRDAFRQQPLVFPVGSIIVRERLLSPTSNPDRLVVMIKHERDFNRKADGWEFLTVSGDATKVIQREKEGNCLNCHASASNDNFVFPLNQKQN